MCFRTFKMIVLTLMLLVGFSAAAMDVCVDHDTDAPLSQTHHCCMQCSHARNATPQSAYAAKLEKPAQVALMLVFDAAAYFQGPYLASLYRPPIVVVVS